MSTECKNQEENVELSLCRRKNGEKHVHVWLFGTVRRFLLYIFSMCHAVHENTVKVNVKWIEIVLLLAFLIFFAGTKMPQDNFSSHSNALSTHTFCVFVCILAAVWHNILCIFTSFFFFFLIKCGFHWVWRIPMFWLSSISIAQFVRIFVGICSFGLTLCQYAIKFNHGIYFICEFQRYVHKVFVLFLEFFI